MTALIAVISVIAILALFAPLVSPSPRPDYYRPDDRDGENRRERKKLRSMLIDLRQELDAGKMSEEEFLSLAGPLSARMDALEKASAHEDGPRKKKNKNEFCIACGHRLAQDVSVCGRCGTERGEA